MENLFYFRDFYKGNKNFKLKPEVTFKQNEHVFDLQGMSLIKDLTGRKSADILAKDYNKSYPFYYINTIWYRRIFQ